MSGEVLVADFFYTSFFLLEGIQPILFSPLTVTGVLVEDIFIMHMMVSIGMIMVLMIMMVMTIYIILLQVSISV